MRELPARIGRYEVIRLLGQGGMGRVMLATDSVLGRQVALKVLRDDLGMPPEVREALVSRMRQEARAAASLSHPNLVTLHDMGEEDSVGLYLVFEYIEGPTLRDRIEAGLMPPFEVARIARALGAALSRAHAAGVIHRDVKPENIMLSAVGPKITDFGIARLPDSKLTRAGSILGTPAYSSPEALATAEFSPRSDQFSLAATLYEALTGHRAFDGDDALQVATRVATMPPASITTLMSGGRALVRADEVLMRALAKDRDRRFASCEAFGDALADALEEPNEPSTLVTGPPRMTAAPVEPQRKWQNLVTGAGVVLAVALFLIVRAARDRSADGTHGVSLKSASSQFSDAIDSLGARSPSSPPAIVPRLAPTRHGEPRHAPSQDAGSTDASAPAIDASAPRDAGPRPTPDAATPEPAPPSAPKP